MVRRPLGHYLVSSAEERDFFIRTEAKRWVRDCCGYHLAHPHRHLALSNTSASRSTSRTSGDQPKTTRNSDLSGRGRYSA